jgi:YggT family protein
VAFVDLLRYSVYILVFAVIVQAILSWVRTYSPFSPVLEAMTRPFLRPFRKLIPPLGGFDLTPLVLLIVLQVVLIVLGHLRPMAATLG